nr:immunoglobulin heavy chain junction region [Homo sapiens]
EDTAVYYCA